MAMSTPLHERQYLNALQVSRLTGLSRPTLLRLLTTGALPGTKLAQRWVISRAAIEEWSRGECQRPRPVVPDEH